jgi:hypothetical protein
MANFDLSRQKYLVEQLSEELSFVVISGPRRNRYSPLLDRKNQLIWQDLLLIPFLFERNTGYAISHHGYPPNFPVIPTSQAPAAYAATLGAAGGASEGDYPSPARGPLLLGRGQAHQDHL